MRTWTGPFYLCSIVTTLASVGLAFRPGATFAAEDFSLSLTSVESSSGTNHIDSAVAYRQMLEGFQRDIEMQVSRHTAAITSSLAQIEPALNRIRQQQADSSATANRSLLIAAGLFAVAGFLGLGFLTLASVRAMGRFTEVAVSASTRRPLPGPGSTATDDAGSSFKPLVSGSVEQASARFQGALEQLERRIKELEHSSHAIVSTSVPIVVAAQSHPAPPPGHAPFNSSLGNGQSLPVDAESTPASAPALATSQIDMQLGKGQALLNLDQASEALDCFNRALAEAPDNTDALLRKGMALEKLQEWDRALECYERAIQLDRSLTVAYLYKGSVCNRLERHREALESYEHALQSEHGRTVAP